MLTRGVMFMLSTPGVDSMRCSTPRSWGVMTDWSIEAGHLNYPTGSESPSGRKMEGSFYTFRSCGLQTGSGCC